MRNSAEDASQVACKKKKPYKGDEAQVYSRGGGKPDREYYIYTPEK